MLTAVSLFTGCGGSDFGLHQAGIQVRFANDILPYARDVYLANLPETDYQVCDISNIRDFPAADILVGCYPCQGFSQGGARKADRKVNYLYRHFVRALKAIKPKAFVVENVSGMQRADFSHLLKSQITLFRLCGYRVTYEIMNSADYGTPQERKRIIIVGLRSDIGERFEFPEPTHGEGRTNDYVTIRQAIGDMPDWPEGEYWTESFHWYYLSRNRRRDWNELSKTIVSHPRHMPLHPISPALNRIHTDKWVWSEDKPARRFSFREASRLQGFPESMRFPETQNSSLREKYRIVGNAVPPQLFSSVAHKLKCYL
ncbi:DNA cytosine methyltransferase [Marinobacter nauticus]|uniref:DNA cytosine methyltransferase n=1 Tax=Marinobacter nauticus TaxID=2743 RepID=UPI001C59DF9D|nr:DNA (cytosine-5-)-methyltransferase [Marinobacter nauticus]MBW3199002.1 DNA cytosine methyltransferase [Marinobacter nauticus]MBY6184412.1 DNA cytosine methyltransferase [Marinobacter nauticus]